ncbi:MAG: rRNA maturation RNase YbeY [Nitrospirae bacterium]|nr:rRNA maturation RNase YbeY [Nitrospirota bacterium]
MKILIKNQQKHRRLNKTKIEKVANGILSLLGQHTSELSILFVGDKKMKELNTIYRGVPKTTDVLSFPQISEKLEVKSNKLKRSKKIEMSYTSHFLFPTSYFLLGDVVINVSKAETQARDLGRNFYDEISRLMIHGILHLLGYEHERCSYKANIMRKKEEEISKCH